MAAQHRHGASDMMPLQQAAWNKALVRRQVQYVRFVGTSIYIMHPKNKMNCCHVAHDGAGAFTALHQRSAPNDSAKPCNRDNGTYPMRSNPRTPRPAAA